MLKHFCILIKPISVLLQFYTPFQPIAMLIALFVVQVNYAITLCVIVSRLFHICITNVAYIRMSLGFTISKCALR